MRIFTATSPILAVGLSMSATMAAADLTAEDVWAAWSSISDTYGQNITVESESYAGGVLSLTGMTTSIEMPDGEASGSLSELTFTENSDGTVSIGLPEEYPFSFTSPADNASAAGRVLMPDLKLVASGTPEAISYAYSAPSITMLIDEVMEDDTPMNMVMSAALENPDGTYDVTASGDLPTIDSALSADRLSLDMSAEDPDGAAVLSMVYAMTDIDGTSTGTLPMMQVGQDLAALLEAGMSSTGSVTSGGTSLTLTVDDGDTPFSLTSSSAGSKFDVDVSPEGLRYGGQSTGIAAEVLLTAMGLPPLTMAIAESSGEVVMPVGVSDEAEAFGLKVNLSQLSLGESAWSMFDPAGQLPRDPANLQLDLSGLGKWSVDVFDPDFAEDFDPMAEGMPGEIDAVDVGLLLSMLGAELTGAGAFTFDNSAFPPAPKGTLDLQLLGGNALIDTLTSAGLLPEEQAMGARMMMGLFAQPGETPDSLTTTVEVQEDGGVFVNGQRMR